MFYQIVIVLRNLQISLLLMVVIFFVGYAVYAKLSQKYELQYKSEVAHQVYLTKNNNMVEKPSSSEVYFAGERVPTEKKNIASKLQWELHLATYWKQGATQTVSKAHYWLPLFEQILKEKDIPVDFKYLAVIESNLTNVVSPAGAAGFWQLMPSAARTAGLEINNEIDERYHPIKATYAAAYYLRYSYKYLKNWTNVAASYNMGIGGIQYTLRASGVDSYYDLFLNPETARYVYKAVAFKQVYENLAKYDLTDVQPYAYPHYRKITVDSTIHNLADFASQYGLSLKTLQRHNPWLKANRLTVREGKTYEVWIPTLAKMARLSETDTLAVKEVSLVSDTLSRSDSLQLVVKEQPKKEAD
ncbi:MAG: lytic transglycosylase domain-containing protein [Thermonemataceae bacterium]